MKLAWEYLYAKCDNAGVIDLDREGAEFHIGAKVEWDEFLKRCGPERIVVLESGKWWLVKFIEFQYGQLSDKSAPHRKVLSLLQNHCVRSSLLVGYQKATGSPKEKDKEEEEEEEEEAPAKPPKSTRKRFKIPTVEEIAAYCSERQACIDPQLFHDHYQARGWKLNGGQAMKDWKAAVRTWERNGFQARNGQEGSEDYEVRRSKQLRKEKTIQARQAAQRRRDAISNAESEEEKRAILRKLAEQERQESQK